MNQKQILFDQEPQRFRNTDPITSEIAADQTSETIGHQRQVVLDLVKQYPDSTSAELAVRGNLDRYTPSRRLSELVKIGLIEVSGKRPSKTNGNLMQTYKERQ